jgi:CTP synthase (UTP-ammonia lyase)
MKVHNGKIEMISFVLNDHCKYLGVGQGMQASTLTYFSTCPFGQLTKKSTCPKKLIKITKTRE